MPACILPDDGVGNKMLMERTDLTNRQSTSYDLDSRLDTVAEMLKGHDGSPVSKSLIRRAVLRSILHLPPNHAASEALDLFYEALETVTVADGRRKARSKSPNTASLIKIWAEARKAIETVTVRLLKASANSAPR